MIISLQNVTDQEIKETFEFPEDIQRKLNTHCYASNMCSLDQSKVDDVRVFLIVFHNLS